MSIWCQGPQRPLLRVCGVSMDTSFHGGSNGTISGYVQLRRPEISRFKFAVVLAVSWASDQGVSGCIFWWRFQWHHRQLCPSLVARDTAVFSWRQPYWPALTWSHETVQYTLTSTHGGYGGGQKLPSSHSSGLLKPQWRHQKWLFSANVALFCVRNRPNCR